MSTLAWVKAQLVGCTVFASASTADRREWGQGSQPYAHQIVNVTRHAVVVAPVINTCAGKAISDRKTSILVDTGVSRWRHPSDVVRVLDPAALEQIRSIYAKVPR